MKPGSAAARGGLAEGDRLVSVNEVRVLLAREGMAAQVFVVFLPVRDVMITFDLGETTCHLEFERWAGGSVEAGQAGEEVSLRQQGGGEGGPQGGGHRGEGVHLPPAPGEGGGGGQVQHLLS